MSSPLPSRRSTQAISFCCLVCLLVAFVGFHAWAQTNQCTTQRNTPGFRGAGFAWPQNAPVTVNINSTQFSPADRDCIQSIFANYNLANESSGNSSGVYFTVTYTSTPIAATINGTAETAATPAATGPYNYQINRPATLEGDNPAAFGQTGTGGTGTYRTSGVTNINSQITNCDALRQTLAHEIGHTFGLAECPNCDARGSVMVGGAAVQNPDGTITRLYNDTSRGLNGPTPCDDQVVRQGVGYNPATVNQPIPGGGGGGGGGGDGGGGGGGDGGGGCTEYWWVEYSCSEEEGRIPRPADYLKADRRTFAFTNHARSRSPELSCVETGRWYAGCW
jgi:hypothetical protein